MPGEVNVTGQGVPPDARYCSYITRDVNNQISLIKTPFVNLQSIKTSGVDFELSYRFDTPALQRQQADELLVGLLVPGFELQDAARQVALPAELMASSGP